MNKFFAIVAMVTLTLTFMSGCISERQIMMPSPQQGQQDKDRSNISRAQQACEKVGSYVSPNHSDGLNKTTDIDVTVEDGEVTTDASCGQKWYPQKLKGGYGNKPSSADVQ